MPEPDEKPPLHLQSSELSALRAAMRGIEPAVKLAEKHEQDIHGKDGIKETQQRLAFEVDAIKKRLDTWFGAIIKHMVILWTAAVGFLVYVLQSWIRGDKGGGQ